MVNLDLLYKPVFARTGESVGRLIVASNRVPVPSNGAPAAGGLAVALQSALRVRGGVWFGWSGKTAPDAEQRETQKKTQGPITFAVSDLTRRDVEDYYHGFANRVLWPICHYRIDLAHMNERHAEGYFRVNEFFARRLMKLLRPDDIVWVHDYHMIPLADELRRLGAKNRIGYFHHIPWPAPATAAATPHYRRLLRAFSAYDVAGFQTQPDADNFRDCLIEAGAARVLADGRIEAFGRAFEVEAFPISIDPEAFALEARLAERNALVKRVRASLEGRDLVIGVDRLDYSKGITHRLEAFGAFLEACPEAAKARVTMLQITPKSRSEVPEYARIEREVAEAVGALNGRFGDLDWTPLRYINKPMGQSALAGLYRLAKVGLVTPLRDGMNLVAKEFVAAQSPEDPGVLVLSQFAGAAQEMTAALIVNPYDVKATAAAIAQAVAMPLEERRERWRELMGALRDNSIDHWAARCLSAIAGEDEAEVESSLHPAGSIVRSGTIADAEPWFCAQDLTSARPKPARPN